MIKNIRETYKDHKIILKKFKKYLTDNLPQSQFVLDSLEYIQKQNMDMEQLWIYAYELQYRVLDLEKDKQNIEKRLTSLENDE